MAHMQRITEARTTDANEPAFHGPMSASTDPKQDFIQSVISAFQTYRMSKRLV